MALDVLSDVGTIQRLAFTLLETLTGFDAAAIVIEKDEDFAALEALGAAVTTLGTVGRHIVADGITEGAELEDFKAALVAAKDAAVHFGIEVADQTTGDGV